MLYTTKSDGSYDYIYSEIGLIYIRKDDVESHMSEINYKEYEDYNKRKSIDENDRRYLRKVR